MKKNILLMLTIFFVMVINSVNLFAEVKLPAIFGNNMVLQQQTDVAVWGTSKNNATVKVITSWNNKKYSIQASTDGHWKLKVATPKAGGPYEITISDGTSLKLKNVLIGEVWVCSGQSNMQMQMKGGGPNNQPVLGSSDAIALSSNPNIRLFTVEKVPSIKPLDDSSGDWETCEPGSVSEFSATAYYFGLMLHKVLNVPVGLINSSYGGTPIQSWISEAGCKKFDFIKLFEEMPVEKPQNTSTVLFNSMINPIVGYGIRGAIWYQGESNRNEPENYQKMMLGLIEDWRSKWGIGDFPFYYMQIAPFDYGKGLNSAFLREAQLNISTALPNIGMACIMDIGEKDCIHPSNKEKGSKRLAFLALAQTYGIKGISGLSPVLKKMIINNGTAKLTFDNAPKGLTSFGKELSCFEIAGSDKKFLPAKAVITNEGITVNSSIVPEPVAVRYAFKDFIIGDLFGINGLPVSSFRTDKWEPEK